MNTTAEKHAIRKRVWDILEDRKIARFPRPVHGRIPNFLGAEDAARRLAELDEFREARTVKVNPDSPQLKVRELVLREGKTLLTPTPRLRSGFLMVTPKRASGRERMAASIRGSASLGRVVSVRRMPSPDLLVVGSVAVSRKDGSRIGKGEGYSEIEYAILRELGVIREDVPVVTTVHAVQLVDRIPHEEHDVQMDRIVTSEATFTVKRVLNRPSGIFWNKVNSQMLKSMPILSELRRATRQVRSNRDS